MPPSEQPTTAVGPVVVGIDGSEGSLVALRVAADEARRRGATLEVVGTPVDAQLEELRRGLADTLADEGLADGNPEVRERVVNGHAAEVLVEASGSAALVVVGTRGHGGLAGKMLGSVSQQVVAHARCPVMVVPHSST